MKNLLVLSKRVILTLAMFMSFLFVYSQEHMTFQGIPIDGAIKNFHKQMKKHGFKPFFLKAGEGAYTYRGRYITNNDLISVHYSSNSKTVDFVLIQTNFSDMLNTESWMKVKENYDYVVNLFSEKYGTAEKETTAYFEAPYEEGDGNEVEGIIKGKCNFFTDFYLPQGLIRVKIDTIVKNLMIYPQRSEDSRKDIPNISIQIQNDANSETNQTKDIQL